jgi:hypothetical protein
MTKLAAPLIIAGVAAALPTLPGWAASGPRRTVAVTEGPRLSREGLREYATVGYVDGDDGPAVTFEATGDAQGQTREAGTIACEVLAAAVDVPTARARVFELLAAWQGWLDNRQTPVALGLLADSRLSMASDVTLTVTRSGATASARVVITYTAHTYG